LCFWNFLWVRWLNVCRNHQLREIKRQVLFSSLLHTSIWSNPWLHSTYLIFQNCQTFIIGKATPPVSCQQSFFVADNLIWIAPNDECAAVNNTTLTEYFICSPSTLYSTRFMFLVIRFSCIFLVQLVVKIKKSTFLPVWDYGYGELFRFFLFLC
jgi:hypothetical protein